MANLNVKKGDAVIVTAGKEKGKSGVISKVIADDNKVLIDGLNIVYKHKKAKNAQEKNEIAKMPAPIDASNVMLVCGACGKATRVSNSREEVDGKTKAVRICKKCGAKIEASLKTKSAAKKVAKATKVAAKKKADDKPVDNKAE